MGKTVELVRNFSKGASTEEVVFFAVEVNAHEIHLHHVSDILLGSLLPIEETRLIILSHRPSRYLIDLHSKGVTPIPILTTQVDAFDLDIDVIQQTQQQLLNEARLLLVLLPLQVRLELLQRRLYYPFLPPHEDFEHIHREISSSSQ